MLIKTLLVSLAITLIKGFPLLVGYIDKSFPPPLSKEEESLYLKILADDKYKLDQSHEPLKVEEAKNKLFHHNLRLVAYIVGKYEKTGIEKADLLQLGGYGLIKGILTYKLDKGFKFSTYASRCIHNEILMELRKCKNWRTDLSLSDPVTTDNAGNTLDFIDILGTDKDGVFDEVESSLEKEVVRHIVKSLPEKERFVIQHRFGLDNKKAQTQSEVAKQLNISRSYVSRIEKKALKMLESQFE